MLEIRLTSGKGDFVRRKTEKGYEEVCLCIYNADVSQGCISQVPPYLFNEVIINQGKYSEKTRKKWMKEKGKLPDERCTYCYDKRHNGKNIAEKIIGKKTKGDFEIFKPAFVRLSKETEWGHSLYRERLLEFLDLCNEYNSKVIFPTKMLEFDKKVANKLLDNQGFLSFSIGRNASEPGCCGYGFTNKFRVEQAEKYYEAGVNTALTMILDITDSIENNEKRGFYVKEALNSKVEVKRIIPIRLTSAKVALEATGIERADLVNPFRAVGHISEWEKYSKETQKRILSIPYTARKNNSLVANFVHSDFKEFEENIRICGQIGKYEYCDKCNLYSDRIKFPIIELVEIEYRGNLQNSIKKKSSKRKGMEKNNKEKIKEKTLQGKLF